jgi:hypothetical protein
VSVSARVLLLGKPGCHLCEDAREVVATVCEEMGVTWQERDILDDPELTDKYWDEIPVVLVDGEQHAFFRVDPQRLRSRLAQRPPTGSGAGVSG